MEGKNFMQSYSNKLSKKAVQKLNMQIWVNTNKPPETVITLN